MARASGDRRDHLIVAARVAWERRRRGWTGQELAERLTKAGCPMDQPTISKLERGSRGISVNELVAFSEVFQRSPERMLSPPTTEDLGSEIAELLDRLDIKRKTLMRASNDVTRTLRELAATLVDVGSFDPQVLDALAEQERAMVRVFDIALEIEANVRGLDLHQVPNPYVKDFR